MDTTLTVAIPLILLGFWAWMFFDFVANRRRPRDQEVWWLLGFIFLGLLTAIYYYFTIYRED